MSRSSTATPPSSQRAMWSWAVGLLRRALLRHISAKLQHRHLRPFVLGKVEAGIPGSPMVKARLDTETAAATAQFALSGGTVVRPFHAGRRPTHRS